ncbi:MAG: Nif3-like dinuclear metal center hexameric protein [Oscillospiraceae bacterium]|nr:Nif3-like dinuclear metal center hexameric protein [Oscillospiraceae bacterium]
MTVQDVCLAMEALAPFATQEPWDNSGLLVGDPKAPVTGVLVTLDITAGAVERAQQLSCNVIVSHHPVIFSPLKRLVSTSIPYMLAQAEMAAVCSHTPLDLAVMNDLLAEKLSEVLPVAKREGFAEPGKLLTLSRPLSLLEIAQSAKEVLGCTSVRVSAPWDDEAQRIAICTGAGASLLEDCEGVADCLLTGDVKHDRWYKAQELGLGLIDCGHYHTEILMVPYVAEKLREALPGVAVTEFVEEEPVAYI